MDLKRLERWSSMASAIRVLSADAVEKAQSGHPGMPLGFADVATVLWDAHLCFYASDPKWPNRDRFVLSAGHGSMLLYSLLALTGFPDITLEDLSNFRQYDAATAGHPEYGTLMGVETTTGPLGQGLANAVGMAMAERHLHAQTDGLIDHWTYAVVGDGCLMEGISHEAASLAGHLGLHRCIVLWDDNRISIDGPTDLTVSEDTLARFRSYGWHTVAIDGHDPLAIHRHLLRARRSNRPVLIACRTVIGHGASGKEGTERCHGSPLGAKEVEKLRENLGWTAAPFTVPDGLRRDWEKAGARHRRRYDAWYERWRALPSERRETIAMQLAGYHDAALWETLRDLAVSWSVPEKKAEATRRSSGLVLEAVAPWLPGLIGGSADLTGSNETRASGMTTFSSKDYGGRYVYFGVREHAMVACLNGMALYGGVVAYGGTFLVFSDYCRPSIRLAAMMRLPIILIFTHDSIGVGEDGPTHQPVEHLASLRMIPGLQLLRPADAVETVESWEIALRSQEAPTALVLSRQSTPPLRLSPTDRNRTMEGAYPLLEASSDPRVILFASGTEVALALAVARDLETDFPDAVDVISVPWLERWRERPDASTYYETKTALRVVIEAASRHSWEWLLRDGEEGSGGDLFCGVEDFGVSAPASEAYRHFGLTVEAIVSRIRQRLELTPAGASGLLAPSVC